MNVGKAILRVLRVFGIIILIPVVLVLLVLLIGFITDLSVTPQWKQAQQESQDYFSKIKTQRYSSGVSFAILDANAWDYYDRAVKHLDRLPGEVKLAVYDVMGRLVRNVVGGRLPAGLHKAAWDGKDALGRKVTNGVYFVRLSSPDRVKTVKAVVVR